MTAAVHPCVRIVGKTASGGGCYYVVILDFEVLGILFSNNHSRSSYSFASLHAHCMQLELFISSFHRGISTRGAFIIHIFLKHYIWRYLVIIMPRCTCASEVYGSVFVCVSVSVCLCRLLQLLKDQRSASKGFYRLLVMFSWISIRGFAK